MANIFLSYSSADKSVVKNIASLLENQGWTVWWDRDIPVGKNFETVIENELDAANCVVVVWTSKSVNSEWVRSEASEAVRQNKLIPIVLEQVELPLSHRNMEAALLFNWNGIDDHPELEPFFKSIKRLIPTLNIQDANSIHNQGNLNKSKSQQNTNAIQSSKNKLIVISLISILILSLAGYFVWKKNASQKEGYIIEMSGIVKSPKGLPIKDVQIIVEGTSHKTVSNQSGEYELKLTEFLPGEEITISTSHPNFENSFFFFKPSSEHIEDFEIYLNPKELK